MDIWLEGWIDRWLVGWTDGRLDKWLAQLKDSCTDNGTNGKKRMLSQIEQRTKGQMEKWMDRHSSPIVQEIKSIFGHSIVFFHLYPDLLNTYILY